MYTYSLYWWSLYTTKAHVENHWDWPYFQTFSFTLHFLVCLVTGNCQCYRWFPLAIAVVFNDHNVKLLYFHSAPLPCLLDQRWIRFWNTNGYKTYCIWLRTICPGWFEIQKMLICMGIATLYYGSSLFWKWFPGLLEINFDILKSIKYVKYREKHDFYGSKLGLE